MTITDRCYIKYMRHDLGTGQRLHQSTSRTWVFCSLPKVLLVCKSRCWSLPCPSNPTLIPCLRHGIELLLPCFLWLHLDIQPIWNIFQGQSHPPTLLTQRSLNMASFPSRSFPPTSREVLAAFIYSSRCFLWPHSSDTYVPPSGFTVQ